MGIVVTVGVGGQMLVVRDRYDVYRVTEWENRVRASGSLTSRHWSLKLHRERRYISKSAKSLPWVGGLCKGSQAC